MKAFGRFLAGAAEAMLCCFSLGCAVTAGSFEPNTQFVYPNSNVKELGYTEATYGKWGVLTFARPLTMQEALKVYHEAIQKVEGANLLVNFDQDTTTYIYVLLNYTEFTIRGQAARMEVGKQDLK